MYYQFDASVGTNVGDIGLWEVGSKEKLVSRNFKVWDLGACSMPLQVFPIHTIHIIGSCILKFSAMECAKVLTYLGGYTGCTG